MSQTLREAPLTTRSARASLPVGVHWRRIDPDTHLGYRKGKRGGRWLVRWYDGQGKYCQATMGTADDVIAEGTLSFDAAAKAARETVVAARRQAAAAKAGPIVTVKLAVEAYIAKRNARVSARTGRTTRSDADSRLALHVLGQEDLASTPLHALKEADLAAWRAKLSGKISTRRRLANDFRAALNAAADAGRQVLPPQLPALIKHGLKTPELEASAPAEPVARENQILSDEEVRRIVQAAAHVDAEQGWDGDLWRMVVVLASTGARFSQVARLRVRDVQASRLFVPTSRKGRSREEAQTPVPAGTDVIKALKLVIEGRDGSANLLERWFHVQRGPGKWERNKRGPWGPSYQITKAFRTIAIAAKLPGTTTYALRHSSIVRGLRAGLPIRLVASLHDTSTPMIERFYGRHIADGLEELGPIDIQDSQVR